MGVWVELAKEYPVFNLLFHYNLLYHSTNVYTFVI